MITNTQFGIKNYNQSYTKHEATITKLKARNIVFSKILGKIELQQVIDTTVNRVNRYYTGNRRYLHTPKSIRQLINFETWEIIKKRLIRRGYYTSWSTPFYLNFYKETNQFMETVFIEVSKQEAGADSIPF